MRDEDKATGGCNEAPPPSNNTLEWFFEHTVKPHIERAAQKLRCQIRLDIQTALSATIADVDEEDTPPPKRLKGAAQHVPPPKGDLGEDEDHSHDLGEFSDDGVLSDVHNESNSSEFDSSGDSEGDDGGVSSEPEETDEE